MLDYLVWNGLLGFIIEAVILIRGISKDLYRRYCPFYVYMSYVISVAILRWSIVYVWGYQSDAYYYSYHLTSVPFSLLQMWILCDFFRKFGTAKKAGRSALGLVILSLVISLPVAYGLLGSRLALFDKFHTLTLPLQAVFCLAACHAIANNRTIMLGKNERGILLGLAMLLALQSLNFAYYAFELRDVAMYTFLVQFIYVVALIILAWHLWEYHPSRFRDTVTAERMARLDTGFQGLVRGLLFRK